jgi:1-acyl-sn-glycerol-3-phosphate acyltransferase
VGQRLSGRDRIALEVQRAVGWLLAPLWLPLCAGLVRWYFGWRVEGLAELRREYARLRRESTQPLLVCPNHLTMLDSAIVAYALGSWPHYLLCHAALPWNVPERRNFASTWWQRVLVYLMKCVPVERGGDRRAVGRSLDRVLHVVERGDVALIFPEGQRGRGGRVDPEATTYGVGRIVKALPRCRVLCVYARGEKQQSWGGLPARHQRFRVLLDCFEPKTDHRGLRGSVDLSRQILLRLAALERRYFDGGQ